MLTPDRPLITLTPEQESAVRLGRLARLKDQMRRQDMAAIVLVDPVNVRYATDTRNMQIFSARNPARYVFIAADGPVVMFEFAGCAHLSEWAETVDEVRIATTASYASAGPRTDERIRDWADEIADLARTHCGEGCRIGLERFNMQAGFALAEMGFKIVDAQSAVELARCIKVEHELDMVRASMRAAEDGVRRLEAAIAPGKTEQEVWSELWKYVIETGGDYVETRLLSSGPRSNPWFQEASDRVLEAGDIVALDTDVVGRYGYYADFSRTFVVGDGRPSDAQRELYSLAYEQIQTNLELMKPGMGFQEVSAKGWVIPERFRDHRYFVLAHGNGMTGEYPYILYKDDASAGCEGVLEENMVLCVESFIGAKDGGEGVKLEQEILITKDGYELITEYPFDERLLAS